MKTINLGDIAAPNVVLGLMRITDLPDDDIRTLIRTARDAGIDFFDHAAVYGNDMHGCERRFAQALRLSPTERAEITIQTKAGIVKEGPYFDFSYECRVLALLDGLLVDSRVCSCSQPQATKTRIATQLLQVFSHRSK